ncbi:hypothetical protein [Methylobacterium sp. J-067]|uniref:hypothetical protein n=1 Tax=Methylobacterium sp. J-067 TaxID=2836648 RepID=UPI001FB8E3FC|nr:hypothetical protein [Methylobacterium sp. J-067]MCJ2023012.1 hypothetical protein [Methylobacterium sp. J-067]
MKLIDLERRLAHIEATRSVSAPTRILMDRALGDPAGDIEAADALANWRQWVEQGRATVRHSVLCLSRPAMTAGEWVAAHVTAE